MLYDPKWEAPTKLKPEPSIAGLIMWLETQNPKRTYDWGDCDGGCLIGQYLAAIGIPWKHRERGLYNRLTPQGKIALEKPHTFGAALERARAVLSE